MEELKKELLWLWKIRLDSLKRNKEVASYHGGSRATDNQLIKESQIRIEQLTEELS